MSFAKLNNQDSAPEKEEPKLIEAQKKIAELTLENARLTEVIADAFDSAAADGSHAEIMKILRPYLE